MLREEDRCYISISNQTIKNIFDEVYNVFWNKYKDLKLTPKDKRWEGIMQDVDEIIRKYNAEDLVTHMLNELIRILENRAKEAEIGLYKPTSPASLDGRRDQTGIRADGRSADDRKDI